MAYTEYRCPPFFNQKGEPTKSDFKLGWLREAIQQGRTFIESQRAYEDMQQALDKISGHHEEKIPEARSRIYVNRLKRQIREVVATESDIRPQWGFKTDNKELEPIEMVLNKLWHGWWLNTFADRSIREAVQYASVMGTGYVSPIWEKDFHFAGRGDIALHTYGPTEILPIQLPRDHDLQKAYTTVICTEVPIATAHAMFPQFADQLVATRERPGWIRKGVQKLKRYMAPALNVGGPRQRQIEDAIFPVVDIYHAYVMDLSINQTGRRMSMGKPGTNWYYEVPFVGEEIAAGYNDKDGRPLYKKAGREDCLIYPLRRLVQATDSVVLSDDTSPWWHGMVPVVKFAADDWPWEALGFSLMKDAHSLQESAVELLRQVQDSGKCRLRPSLQYDSNVIAQTTMDRLDTRSPGQHLAVDTSMGEFVKPLLPPEYYEVPAWIPAHVDTLWQLMDYLMAVPDMAAIAKARQLPASETIEKIVQLAGPLIRDMSRGMERPLAQLGEMNKGLFFQFYNANRRIPLLGKDGITSEDWDYDASSLVPEYLPGRDRWERARYLMSNLPFSVQPNSAHQVTQVTRQLMYLQLWRAGFPIDPWTVGEALDIPHYGKPPDGTVDVYDRWKAWNIERADMAQVMQMLTAVGAQGAGVPPGGGGGGAQPGRPPSGGAPPKIVQKDGGSRSTISESR
jgi:hypothetical protein